MAGLRYLSRKPAKTYTHEEIADVCGVTKSSVFEMEEKALKKLRCLLLAKGISQ